MTRFTEFDLRFTEFTTRFTEFDLRFTELWTRFTELWTCFTTSCTYAPAGPNVPSFLIDRCPLRMSEYGPNSARAESDEERVIMAACCMTRGGI